VTLPLVPALCLLAGIEVPRRGTVLRQHLDGIPEMMSGLKRASTLADRAPRARTIRAIAWLALATGRGLNRRARADGVFFVGQYGWGDFLVVPVLRRTDRDGPHVVAERSGATALARSRAVLGRRLHAWRPGTRSELELGVAWLTERSSDEAALAVACDELLERVADQRPFGFGARTIGAGSAP